MIGGVSYEFLKDDAKVGTSMQSNNNNNNNLNI